MDNINRATGGYLSYHKGTEIFNSPEEDAKLILEENLTVPQLSTIKDIKERSVDLAPGNYEAGKNKDIDLLIVKQLKTVMAALQNRTLDNILDEIYDYCHSDSNQKTFYYHRLIKQKDTSSDVDFMQIILEKITETDKKLTEKQYKALCSVAFMMTKKNLYLDGVNLPIYDKIYNLIEYLAEHKVSHTIRSVSLIAKYVKGYPSLIAEKNADQILVKLYDTIKNPIKRKLLNNSYNSKGQEFIAKNIPEILQQIATTENKVSLINEWLEDKKLFAEFNKTFIETLKNIGLVSDSEYAELEQSYKIHETIISHNNGSDKREDKTELQTLIDNINFLDVKKFENFVNQDSPLKGFINSLNELGVTELIILLNQDFEAYTKSRNLNPNFFTQLFANANSELYIELIEVIGTKIGGEHLNDDASALIENIAFRMHLTMSKTDDTPIEAYDKIYQLMDRVADSGNIKHSIRLLQKITGNKNKYKFPLFSPIDSNVIYGGYLELLTKIFVKKQDAQIYNLYNDMKDNIAANIKSKSDTPIKLIKNVATAIFNIGKQLRFQADKDNYFKYWLAEDTGISKKFQDELRKLLHQKD